MDLSQELYEASLDGVKFLVSNSSTKGGRRQAEFEFISTNRRQVQDLGRYLRKFEVTGYVQNNPNTNQNYFSNRDALLKVLESDGQHTLTHPFYGEIKVTTGIYSIKESINQLGIGEITFTATQVSESINKPLPKTNQKVTPKTVADQSAVVTSKLKDDSASKFSLTKKFKDAYQSAKDMYTNTMNQIQKVVKPIADEVNDAVNFVKDVENDIDQVNTLLNNPSSLFGTIIDDITGIDGFTNNINTAIAGLKRFNQFGDALNSFGSGVPTTDQSGFAIENLSPFVRVPENPITAQETEIKTNADLISDTVKQSSLAKQYELAVQVDYANTDDLDQAIIDLEDQFNVLRGSIGDTVYNDFAELRQLANQVFESKRDTTLRVSEFEVQGRTALSLLAYSLYEDSTQQDSLRDLNNSTDVTNITGTIKVLTNAATTN
jgi:prophage DNA circulation protein